MYRNAWLSDDAYITFRVVDNFVNGYGLTWNVIERVQTYTHPLWMFLLSLLYFLTHEIYFTSIFLSILLSILILIIFLFWIAPSVRAVLVGGCLLLFSKSFIDYSSSGLENPLTHLLLVIFFFIYFFKNKKRHSLLYLSLIASFCMLNRMDTILLTIPVLIYQFFTIKVIDWKTKSKFVLAGFTPFLIWEAFSLFYYGFLFPNTAYAKLNTGIPESDYMIQGLYYFFESTRMDYLTLPFIIFALVMIFYARNSKLIFAAIGIVLYLLYILWIGGDFMGGRFLTAPFICAVVLFSQIQKPLSNTYIFTILFVISIGAGLFSPAPPVLSGENYGKQRPNSSKGIMDERAFYYQDTGLLRAGRDEIMPYGLWADEGRLFKLYKLKFQIRSNIGMIGYLGGPDLYILDKLALADPLLARLPISNVEKWSIGHFKRDIPFGYIETLKKDNNSLVDKDLAVYYNKLCLLIRGNLFSQERFKEIFKFLFGLNNVLIESYLKNRTTENVFGFIFNPATQAYPWIMQSLQYDYKGEIDSSSYLFLQMYQNKIELLEDEKYYWGWAMNYLYKSRFMQINLDNVQTIDVLYMLRLFSFTGVVYNTRDLLRSVMVKPMGIESLLKIAEAIRALKEEDIYFKIAEEMNSELWPPDIQKAINDNFTIMRHFLVNPESNSPPN